MKIYSSNSDILNNGYFLISDASDHLIEFHEIQYFQSKQELLEYIKNEYTATNAEEVTKYSLEELIEGQVYKIDHRQGMHQSEVRIVLVHSTNLILLFNALKKVEIEDEDGETVNLSAYMRDAESSEDIQEIIDIYNESFDCYW